jgi:YgiT-type zinc finger domain-containing protein
MNKEEKPDQTRYTCPECHAGLMQKDHVTYLTWLMGELITVPDFPAWICDVCGRCDYDPQAVSRLNILLSSGSSVRRRPRKQRKTPPEQPSARP